MIELVVGGESPDTCTESRMNQCSLHVSNSRLDTPCNTRFVRKKKDIAYDPVSVRPVFMILTRRSVGIE